MDLRVSRQTTGWPVCQRLLARGTTMNHKEKREGVLKYRRADRHQNIVELARKSERTQLFSFDGKVRKICTQEIFFANFITYNATVLKNEKFGLTQKKFRQINLL